MLVKDVLKEFAFDCEIRKISPRTLKVTRTIINTFTDEEVRKMVSAFNY